MWEIKAVVLEMTYFGDVPDSYSLSDCPRGSNAASAANSITCDGNMVEQIELILCNKDEILFQWPCCCTGSCCS